MEDALRAEFALFRPALHVTHQYSHAWIDFRGVRDKFMREHECDYFENSRRATIVQREYALANPRGFKGYGENCWGFSACEGPGKTALMVDGVRRRFLAYAARGVPFGPEDGMIAVASAVSSLPFAPELSIPVLRHVVANSLGVTRQGRLANGFNPTFPSAGSAGWVSSGSVGLDQGILVLMIENHRSGTHLVDHASVPPSQAGIATRGISRRLARRHPELRKPSLRRGPADGEPNTAFG